MRTIQRPSPLSSRLRFLGRVHHTIAAAIARATRISRNTHSTLVSLHATGEAPLSAIVAGACIAAAALALAGCAGAPPAKPATAVEPLACPPPAARPACPAAPAATSPAVTPRGRLQPADWKQLPDWKREPLKPALEAFIRGCPVLERRHEAWKSACVGAQVLVASGAGEAQVAAFLEEQFALFQVLNGDDGGVGMVTGYYEPLLRGSRRPSPRYRYPLYGVPPDLLVIDLAELHPDLKHRRLRGRLEGNRVVPYLARGDIDSRPAPLDGSEIAWVDDAVDAFFLHIQGSGQVELDNGERVRIGYADQNGHPFRSLGGALVRDGEIPPERASMQGIKEWARHNPAKLREYLNANPSYVFFRELPRDLPGPLGAMGIPLTPQRSLAVDPRVVPLGAPVFLATTWPNAADPLNRLMVAQDTGGAITGGVRADFFWGFGDEAGALAGRMRQAGRMWVLLPKDLPAPAP